MYPELEVLSYEKCKSYGSLATLDSATLVAASSTYVDIIDINGQVRLFQYMCTSAYV